VLKFTHFVWRLYLRRRPAGSLSRERPRGVRLRLEDLEKRALLSAAGLGGLIARPDLHAVPLAGSSGSISWTPAQIRHAYGVDQITFVRGDGSVPGDGSGQTIAIVDAFDDPNIAHDLQVFDERFGLPAPPSFTRVDQAGGSHYPRTDGGWAQEIALDVEWAHALAPRANLLLVEANSDSTADLLAAVDQARHQAGVAVVSMSWGTEEFAAETTFDGSFTAPAGHGAVAFVASSGDGGAGVLWPAVAPDVLSVGGTSLTLNGGSYQGETAWAKSGGGFSRYEPAPPYQPGAHRASPDVAYDADPDTGFKVYDSVAASGGASGWIVLGGTSAGAPQWAALLAVADQGRALEGKGPLGNAAAAAYALPAGDFHDVTGGSNGHPAGPGSDLVTGRGSPIANKLVPDLLGATDSAVRATTAAGHRPAKAVVRHEEAPAG
jgi:subtilase family serine protease